MKFKFLSAAFTGILLSASCFVNVANAGLISTADCQAANTTTLGSCVTVAEWHNTGDDFGGLKKATFADDLFLTVSDSGTYNKVGTYEELAGYHWATSEEMATRLTTYLSANGDGDLQTFNYHGQGGWAGYNFANSAGDLVDRRYFVFSDTATSSRVIHAGIKEYLNITSTNSVRVHYSNASTEASNWAGFVLIKDPTLDVPEPPAIAIFVLGLIGLASRQFNKNHK